MREVLVEEYRGGILECEYLGHIAIVGEDGEVKYSIGDTDFLTFFRSSAKPIQAIPLIKRGAREKFGFTDQEITVMCGSHRAEKFHVEAVEGIMSKIGIGEEELVCLPTYPLMASVRQAMIRDGMCKRSVYHNCSGKHMGILSLCEIKGCHRTNYWDIENPAQQEILSYISEISEYPKEDIKIGVDGCGVPVFAAPLRNLANSYLRLACPDLIDDKDTGKAVETITRLMNENPKVVAGTNLICSLLLEDDNIVAKGGAKGVYCFGLKKERLGIAIKVMDGSEDAWPFIVISILQQIDYGNKETIDRMKSHFKTEVTNDNNRVIGERKSVFNLLGGKHDRK